MLTLGQIKLYMGPMNKNPKKKNQNFDFEFAKLDFCKKKLKSTYQDASFEIHKSVMKNKKKFH